jgi:chemotaxis protein CheX
MKETFNLKIENGTAEVKLVPILDMAVADLLLSCAKECVQKASHVEIDGQDVERLSTPCVQVLLAAAKAMADKGGRFLVKNVSSGFERGMKDLGLEEYLLNWSTN